MPASYGLRMSGTAPPAHPNSTVSTTPMSRLLTPKQVVLFLCVRDRSRFVMQERTIVNVTGHVPLVPQCDH